MDISVTSLTGCVELIEVNKPAPGQNMIQYLVNNKNYIDDLLIERGSIILRGFDPLNVNELSEAVTVLGGKEIFYKGGLGPRTKVGKGVYTASDISKIFPIKLHQEMSYQDDFPDNVCFYCDNPSDKGGETTLADIRKISAEVPEALQKKLKKKNVRYVSVFHDRKNSIRETIKKIVPFYLHLTWQEAFGSDDRKLVEAECERRKLEFHWRNNGDLETATILPAYRQHPLTGEEIWFNSIASLHFNPKTLYSDFGNLIYYMRMIIYANRKNLPNQIYFGDGTEITYSELLPVYHAFEKYTYPHAWRRGDLMLIDNRLVAHGRNSFRGPRRILASLINERFKDLSKPLAKSKRLEVV